MTQPALARVHLYLKKMVWFHFFFHCTNNILTSGYIHTFLFKNLIWKSSWSIVAAVYREKWHFLFDQCKNSKIWIRVTAYEINWQLRYYYYFSVYLVLFFDFFFLSLHFHFLLFCLLFVVHFKCNVFVCVHVQYEILSIKNRYM